MASATRFGRHVHNRYLLSLLVPAVLATIAFSVNYWFLKKAGEYESVERIVARQIENGGLYNSGIGDLTYEYKLALYERVKPKVAVIGSSRAMQFHGAPFRVPFVNLGGAMHGIGEGKILLESMLARHQPEVVIIAVDFWWFNGAIDEPDAYRLHGLRKRAFRMAHLYKPFTWFAAGKLTPPTYLRVLAEGVKNLGIQAIVWGEGYDRYGATHYPGRIDGSRPHKHKRFRATLGWVADAAKGLAHGKTPSKLRLAAFRDLVRSLEEAGVSVVTVLTPLAPRVLDAMASSDGYGYIDILRRDLARDYRWHVDAHDSRDLGGEECEFLDGSHGGAVINLRILEVMAGLASSPIAGLVDRDAIRRDIAANSGHATVRRPGDASPNEVDFLDIGCAKPRDRPARGH